MDEFGSSPGLDLRAGRLLQPPRAHPFGHSRQKVTLRESQLQSISQVGEPEGLEQMRARLQPPSLTVGMVDARAEDRETRTLAPQPQRSLERLGVGRLDEHDVRVAAVGTVDHCHLVAEPSDDFLVEAPNVFVGFDDQETSHEHVLEESRMFSGVGRV